MSPIQKWCLIILAILPCLLVRDAFAQVERPAALVYRLQGAATVTEPPAKPRPLRLFDRLPAGAILTAGPGTRLSLAFANGRRYDLGARSKVTVGPEDLAARSGPVLALSPVPPLPLLPPIAGDERPGSRAGAVRIRTERIGGLYPRHGAATLADATSLRFEPVEGAARYQVDVFDREGNAVFVTGTTNTAVDLPAGSLLPGTRYDWMVRTVDRVGPVARGEASFVTLPADLAAAREELRKAAGTEEDGGALSLLAAVDRGLGMLLEARQGLRSALDRSPEDAALAAELAAVEQDLTEEPAAPSPSEGVSGAAQILHTWGEMLRRRDAGRRAETYYRLALLLVPRDSLAAARELHALGIIARRRGDDPAARLLLQEAYSIREKLAPGSLDFAASLGELGVMMALRGDVIEAEERFKRVLDIQLRFAPDSAETAGTMINLGIIAQDRGDFAVAENHHRRAVELLERLGSSHDLELARAFSCLGLGRLYRGELAAAEEAFRRALELRRKLAPESLNVAGSLQNLGIIAERRGELAAAEELHRQALAIRERLAPGTPHVSESLANLGTIERRKGDLEQSEAFYRQALEMEDKNSPERYAAMVIRIERALVAVERNDLELAEELYRRALSWLNERYPESLHVAEALEGLSRIAFERGRLKEAEVLLRRALPIQESMAPGSARQGRILNALGQIERRAGRPDAAAELFCRATEAFDQQRKKLGGTVEGRSAFGRTTAEVYHDCLSALIDAGRPEDAFGFLERGRARTFLDLLAERDLAWTADLPPDLAEEQRLVAAEYDRTQAVLARLSPLHSGEEVSRLSLRLRELRVHQEEIAAKVRQTSPRNAALQDPRPLDLAAVRRVLDPGTLLLAWSIGQERSFLFVVQPQTTAGPGLEVFPIAQGDQELRQRVESFRNLLQRPDSDPGALAAQAREIYDLLLRPADARIATATRLLVSPDGPLHVLPFAALIRDGRYLAEQKPFHTVASATVYAELKKAPPHERAPGSRLELAAFGAPSYPTPPGELPAARPAGGERAARGMDLPPLPASRDEVQAIAALYPAARTFLGAEATEEHAKTIGREARYLHFACHGLLDERFPLNSALALSIPSQPREGQDNGLLQAWEIFESVRLEADLVTLSACDSALGSEMGGEGLLGLTRAFQYAGARSVLASLWSVSDTSTADLMKWFYGRLRAGRPKDEALRQAQVAAIRSGEYSHPYYWAAFQLAGDWK